MTYQELAIRNSDDTLHNVHSASDDQQHTPGNIGQAEQGMETRRTFSRPEMSISIGCNLSAGDRWMRSYVSVFDHPFHTTSGDTGTCELHLPPGTYEMVAWHEKYGEQVSAVELIGGETLELDFTFSEELELRLSGDEGFRL